MAVQAYTAGMCARAVLRDLGSEPTPERFIAAVLPWVVEAGRPFFDWYFGTDRVEGIVRAWMVRPSSEIAISRATVAKTGRTVVGGFIALDGTTLRTCRLADAIATLWHEEDPARHGAMRERISAAGGLFPAVESDTLYLSKIGVLPEFRGRGLGRWLVERSMERCRRQGLRRMRLDVSATNVTALRLYRSMGFIVVSRSQIPGTSLRYLAMALPAEP
jgi:GNAT superfamily N-acetyltransferase